MRKLMRKIQSGEGSANDARVLLGERMLGSMEQRGFQKPAWLTPMEFARTLPAKGSERERVGAFTEACRICVWFGN